MLRVVRDVSRKFLETKQKQKITFEDRFHLSESCCGSKKKTTQQRERRTSLLSLKNRGMAALGLPFINSLNLPKEAAKRLNSSRSNNYNHGICIPFSSKLKPSYKSHGHVITNTLQKPPPRFFSLNAV